MIDVAYVAAGALTGLVVGLTGVGGGAQPQHVVFRGDRIGWTSASGVGDGCLFQS